MIAVAASPWTRSIADQAHDGSTMTDRILVEGDSGIGSALIAFVGSEAPSSRREGGVSHF
jgi:hypothetical protein